MTPGSQLMTLRTIYVAGCQVAPEMDTRAFSEQNDTPKGVEVRQPIFAHDCQSSTMGLWYD